MLEAVQHGGEDWFGRAPAVARSPTPYGDEYRTVCPWYASTTAPPVREPIQHPSPAIPQPILCITLAHNSPTSKQACPSRL